MPATAEATPCWPAPVSAMMRGLPISRRADPGRCVVDFVRAGVEQSSRLSKCAAAKFSVRREANCKGVGGRQNSSEDRGSRLKRLIRLRGFVGAFEFE